MTAREVLCQHVIQLLSKPLNEENSRRLWDIIEQFRIQAKPGNVLLPNKTARETLVDRILVIWQNQQESPTQQLLDVIDGFRMQNKQVIEPQTTPKASTQTPKSSASAIKKTKDLLEQDLPSLTPQAPYEPIGGGPQKRGSARGQCPKCHSMGVVLARSYTGDEYFSCIYCGHQSFRAGLDPDMDLPLAAELLQRKFDENDQDD